MSPERVKPGQLPCRWHWVEVSAGHWPLGQLLYELRKPLAPPLSSEISFCCALRPVLLYAHPLPLSAPFPFWICLRQSAFPFTSLSISRWIFWSPLSSCMGATHSPSSRALERSQLPSPALHQPLPSLSPGEVPRRDPLWGGEGQPTALSRCPGSCPSLQRQTQCRKLSSWGAQTHVWGLLGSRPCSLFDLKEQMEVLNKPHVLPGLPGTDLALGSGNGPIFCAGRGWEPGGLLNLSFQGT